MDALPEEFDVLLLGTSLPQAILAAALSVQGLSVLHVDPSPLYGSYDATLTISDLLSLSTPTSSNAYLLNPLLSILPSAKPDLEKHSRAYALTLRPALIGSFSPLISQLVQSGLSKQSAFQLLQSLYVYSASSEAAPPGGGRGAAGGKATRVPASKEDIFRSPLPLLTKRRLMRFLLWVSGTSQPTASPTPVEELEEVRGREEWALERFLEEVWGLEEAEREALGYAVALCVRPSDPTLPALKTIRTQLRAYGRYGPSSFLLGHYGGPGELVQLFCRMAAVRGAPYILGHEIERLELPENGGGEGVKLKMRGIEEVFRARKVVMQAQLVPTQLRQTAGEGVGGKSARCIAILEQALVQEEENLDTALLVFPPGSLGEVGLDRAVTCLWTGEGSKSTPAGRYAAYLSVPLDPGEEGKLAKDLLEPYLQAFIRLTGKPEQEPLLTFYYTFVGEGNRLADEGEKEREGVYVLRGIGEGLAEMADRAAELAQEMFGKVVGPAAAEEGMWAGLESQGEEDEGDEGQEGDEGW